MFSLSGLGTSGMMKTRFPRSLLTSTDGPGAVQVGIALSAATLEATFASRPGELPDEFAVGLLLAHAAVKTSSAATAAARAAGAFTNVPRRMPASNCSSIQWTEDAGFRGSRWPGAASQAGRRRQVVGLKKPPHHLSDGAICRGRMLHHPVGN